MPHSDRASQTRSQTVNTTNMATSLCVGYQQWKWRRLAWLAFVRRGLASLGVRCDSLRRCCGAVTLADVCPQALPAVQLSSLAALRQTGTGTVQDFAAISLIQSDFGQKDSREVHEIDWSARLSDEGFCQCLNSIFQTSNPGHPDASQRPHSPALVCRLSAILIACRHCYSPDFARSFEHQFLDQCV